MPEKTRPNPARRVKIPAEAGEWSGASIIKTHRCHPSALENWEHVAVDVCTEEAKPLSPAPHFALTSDSCTDQLAKKEEMPYVRYSLPNHVVTHCLSLQALEGGNTKSILTAYKAAFEQAAIPLEVWVRRLVELCTDGANVMVGTTSGLVGLLRALQQEVTPHAYFCSHACQLPSGRFRIKRCIEGGPCIFGRAQRRLATVGCILQLFPRVLREFASELGAAVLKFGRLQDRRWAAFAYGALQSMGRSYPVVVCALDSKKLRDSNDQVKQQGVLYLITSYTFVVSLHFMLDVVGACAGMSQIMRLKRRCIALEDFFFGELHRGTRKGREVGGPGVGWFSKRFQKTPQTRSKKNVSGPNGCRNGAVQQKKNRKAPKKEEEKRPNKKEYKKSEEDSNVNQAPSIHAPFLTLIPHPLVPLLFWNATTYQLPNTNY